MMPSQRGHTRHGAFTTVVRTCSKASFQRGPALAAITRSNTTRWPICHTVHAQVFKAL